MTPRARRAGLLVVGPMSPTVGGISSVIDDQLMWLRQAGVDFTAYNTGAALRSRPGSATLQNLAAVMRDAVGVARSVRRSRASLVVVHSVGSPLMPLLRCAALVAGARLSGAPVVVHVHAFDLEAVLPESRPMRITMRIVGRLSGAMVVLHRRAGEALVGATRRQSAVHVIPNMVDVGLYDSLSHEAGIPISMGPVRACFVGTVGARKGVPDLVAALREVGPGVVCTFAGGAAEESVDTYAAVVEGADDLVASGQVRFLGEQTREQARELLQRSHLFLLPSRAEGMPMALLEAMACRLPVVITDVGAMGEIVAAAGCGVVVPPGDRPALAAAIGALTSDPTERERAGESARRYVVANHSESVVCTATLALYRANGLAESVAASDLRDAG